MKYVFSAVFTKIEGEEGYLVKVPDLPGCVSSGKNLIEAIEMITDAMELWLVTAEDLGKDICKPTPQHEISIDKDQEVALIKADTIEYRIRTETKTVRKNVSLPSWMSNLADKKRINCSALLQQALLKQFEA